MGGQHFPEMLITNVEPTYRIVCTSRQGHARVEAGAAPACRIGAWQARFDAFDMENHKYTCAARSGHSTHH